MPMPLPPKLSLQTIARMSGDRPSYEAHKGTIEAHNDLINALGPGDTISPSSFSLSPSMGTGAKILSTSGTVKRGSVTFQVGTASISANPTLTLFFPKGVFTSAPFAQVVQNGGSGALAFTYAESMNSMVVSLAGTPTASTTYTLQFAMRD